MQPGRMVGSQRPAHAYEREAPVAVEADDVGRGCGAQKAVQRVRVQPEPPCQLVGGQRLFPEGVGDAQLDHRAEHSRPAEPDHLKVQSELGGHDPVGGAHERLAEGEHGARRGSRRRPAGRRARGHYSSGLKTRPVGTFG